MSLKTGSLLIASPEIEDPLLTRSTVLLCDHSHQGSFGIILNKPIDSPIPGEILPDDPIVNSRVALRLGGPINMTQLLLLHTDSELEEGAIEVCPGVFLGGDLDFLHSSLTRANGPDLLLCFGYITWAEGMLDVQCEEEEWIASTVSSGLIFHTPAGLLWKNSLLALGGKYASFASIPEDLTLN